MLFEAYKYLYTIIKVHTFIFYFRDELIIAFSLSI